jgi:hypothetical protein
MGSYCGISCCEKNNVKTESDVVIYEVLTKVEGPPDFKTGYKSSRMSFEADFDENPKLNFLSEENRVLQCSAILGPTITSKIPDLSTNFYQNTKG